MTIRDATRAVLLVALAASPALATAGISARAGVLYSRYDAWSDLGGRADPLPHLDVDLALDARGVVVSRDVVDYDLGVSWGRKSDEIEGGAEFTALAYKARASIFANEVSPITVNLSASRGETDFSTATSADAFGQGIANSAGGSLALRGTDLPTLTTSYVWSQAETTIPGQPLRETTQQTLSSSLLLQGPTLSIQASYNGELRDGSWPTDVYQAHGASLSGRALVGGVAVALDAASAMTRPGELVAGTFDQQSTAFAAYVSSQGTDRRRSFSYRYGHSFVESFGAPRDEIVRQSLRYEGDHFLTRRTFFTRWILDASYAETRCEARASICRTSDPTLGSLETELRTTGETLGGEIRWRRTGGRRTDEAPARANVPASTFELRFGPRVSLLQSERIERGLAGVSGTDATTRGETGGYGASAGVRYSRPLGVHSLQADWSGSLGQDVYATAGWQLHQTLGASITGPAATARYTARLRANAFRTHTPATSGGAGRKVEAAATLSTRRVALDARASVSEGMVGATPEEFASDGLLLPAPFDSLVIDASLGAQVKLFTGLASKLNVHFGRSDIPGRPVLHELSATASISYSYASLSMGVEDRFSRVETAAGFETANLVMFRVSRSFQW